MIILQLHFSVFIKTKILHIENAQTKNYFFERIQIIKLLKNHQNNIKSNFKSFSDHNLYLSKHFLDLVLKMI